MITQTLDTDSITEMALLPDNKGRRSGIDRRQFSYAIHIPERRSGMERRSGIDRRNRLRI